jgi:site-specific recombinase XerD
MNNSPFLQHIIETMREKRYAKRTIEAYLYWIKFYINFHNKQHPAQLNDSDVEAFLNFLVNKRINLGSESEGSPRIFNH